MAPTLSDTEAIESKAKKKQKCFFEDLTSFQTLPHNKPEWYEANAADASSLIKRSSIDLIITSPPYWQRRDYAHEDQLGQESKASDYIDKLVHIINGWKPLLRKHGSVFINIGDTYENKALVGIPARLEIALRNNGWSIVNHIIWAKSNGTPQPRSRRLANRHESIFQITCAKDYYFDIHRLSSELKQSANPGDLWELSDDVWKLEGARNMSNHLAPFPPELAERALLLACPQYICSACGKPFERVLEPTSNLNVEKRPQARRAMELFNQHNLTEEHLKAIRAVGIADAGKGRRIQTSANSAKTTALALEAKNALGGYFREFTFAPKRQIGWIGCECNKPIISGTVLDPFMGTGTTLKAADLLGFSSFGIDLTPPQQL
ncbi:hypothetical protein JYG30_09815 [Fibrella sp. USSR17]